MRGVLPSRLMTTAPPRSTPRGRKLCYKRPAQTARARAQGRPGGRAGGGGGADLPLLQPLRGRLRVLLARTGRPTKRLMKRKVTSAPEVSVPARACAGKRSSRAPSTIDGQNARLSLRSDLPSRNGQRIFDHPGRAHPRAVSRHYSPRGTHQPPRPQPAPAGRRLRTAAPLASVLLRSDHVARGAHGASGAVRGARGELQGRHGPCGSRAEPECRYQDSPVWPSLT